jgi:hypothetical protein
MKIKTYRNTKVQWVLSANDGKQLEILAADENGEAINGAPYPLATIVADDADEELMIELYTKEGIVRFPLKNIQQAQELATDEVRSETWYEKSGHYEEDQN